MLNKSLERWVVVRLFWLYLFVEFILFCYSVVSKMKNEKFKFIYLLSKNYTSILIRHVLPVDVSTPQSVHD